MTVEMTYVALKPLRIGGQRREIGELVPEAATWKRAEAWVNQGRIAVVAKSAVDTATLEQAAMKAVPYIESIAGTDEAISEAAGGEIETFATGNGWYEVPGADKKMRHDEAVAFLASLEDDEE